MLELTIRKEMFLSWYFDYGQDQENETLRNELTDSIINQLYKSGCASISVNDLFENCNKGSIRLYFTCQHQIMVDYDWEMELGDLNEKYTIELI